MRSFYGLPIGFAFGSYMVLAATQGSWWHSAVSVAGTAAWLMYLVSEGRARA